MSDRYGHDNVATHSWTDEEWAAYETGVSAGSAGALRRAADQYHEDVQAITWSNVPALARKDELQRIVADLRRRADEIRPAVSS